VEPTAESMTVEGQELTGLPLEAEPPLGSSRGMSFWMFIVVRLYIACFYFIIIIIVVVII